MIKHVLLAVGLSLFTLSAHAQEVSCDDLTDMADVLDEVADIFANGLDGVEEDGYVDTQLAELTAAVTEVAAAEGDRGLSRNAGRMRAAWQEMDADGFQDALDNVIGAVDRLYYRDCE